MAGIVWKGYVSFGLVSFQVRLTAAARPETVRFHMLHKKDLARIKEVWFCSEENKPVDRADIVKGYESGKEQYVVVDPDELKAIAPKSATTMEIVQFVKRDDVDPIFLEKSYYVVPEEAARKPYALLLAAMNDTKYYAVAKVAMHGREHVVILRPTDEGMVAHTMYFVDELHAANKAGQKTDAKLNKKEVDLARQLIENLAGPFKPEQFHDEYRANVERLIEQKQKGEKPAAVRQPKPAPVVDILQALQASLKQSAGKAKKPAKRAGRAA